jgi:hypothetical protein
LDRDQSIGSRRTHCGENVVKRGCVTHGMFQDVYARGLSRRLGRIQAEHSRWIGRIP